MVASLSGLSLRPRLLVTGMWAAAAAAGAAGEPLTRSLSEPPSQAGPRHDSAGAISVTSHWHCTAVTASEY